ncbi:MAG: hypothetical protein U9M95_01715, partial [Candidatus Altiarchaeota archaeon]|nr:hypothetical protein [Candidatus Altiarchaeota archaeon]
MPSSMSREHPPECLDTYTQPRSSMQRKSSKLTFLSFIKSVYLLDNMIITDKSHQQTIPLSLPRPLPC